MAVDVRIIASFRGISISQEVTIKKTRDSSFDFSGSVTKAERNIDVLVQK